MSQNQELTISRLINQKVSFTQTYIVTLMIFVPVLFFLIKKGINLNYAFIIPIISIIIILRSLYFRNQSKNNRITFRNEQITIEIDKRIKQVLHEEIESFSVSLTEYKTGDLADFLSPILRLYSNPKDGWNNTLKFKTLNNKEESYYFMVKSKMEFEELSESLKSLKKNSSSALELKLNICLTRAIFNA